MSPAALLVAGALVGAGAGVLAGKRHRDETWIRWLRRNAWALRQKGEAYGAALVSELAEGRAVVCAHGLDAGSCPHCLKERLRAGEAIGDL